MQTTQPKAIRYHTDRGHVACLLVKRGRTLIHLIPMDSAGIRLVKVPMTEERYFTDLDTTISKAKKIFRGSAKKFGVTKTARAYLRG